MGPVRWPRMLTELLARRHVPTSLGGVSLLVEELAQPQVDLRHTNGYELVLTSGHQLQGITILADRVEQTTLNHTDVSQGIGGADGEADFFSPQKGLFTDIDGVVGSPEVTVRPVGHTQERGDLTMHEVGISRSPRGR